MVEGISHITLIVRDIDKTAALYKTVFGAEEVYRSDEQQFSLAPEVYLLIGGVWFCLMQGEPDARRSYAHIALQVPPDRLDECARRLHSNGIAPEPGRSRVPGEGQSLYFTDYDGYLFELHAGTLAERLETYRPFAAQ